MRALKQDREIRVWDAGAYRGRQGRLQGVPPRGMRAIGRRGTQESNPPRARLLQLRVKLEYPRRIPGQEQVLRLPVET